MNNSTSPKKRPNYAPEVRQRAVRMVLDHQGDYPSRWAAIDSVAKKIGCAPQSLHEWVRKTEVDSGKRAGVTTDKAEKMKALERENRELRQANEILRKASAYFAQAELDRPFKR
jgi:transposase